MLRYHIPLGLSPEQMGHLHSNLQGLLASRGYTKGTLVRELALDIEDRTGYEHAIPLGSGTSALCILARWYWKKGFRRIRAPAFTWPSTYKPFEWCGYQVKFVDIDPETFLPDLGDWKLDNDELAVPVDTFGSVYPIKDARFVGAHALEPFVDSAQSLGAKWDTAMPNRVVSLSGSKIITSGEGGFLLTQDAELYDFAMNCNWLSRMPELSAALGLAYMARLDEILMRKQAIADEYRRRLKSVNWQKIPIATNNYIVAGLVDSPRDWQKSNPDVEFRFYYDSIVNEEDEPTKYANTVDNTLPALPKTRYVSRHILAFPSFPEMTMQDIEKVREP